MSLSTCCQAVADGTLPSTGLRALLTRADQAAALARSEALLSSADVTCGAGRDGG